MTTGRLLWRALGALRRGRGYRSRSPRTRCFRITTQNRSKIEAAPVQRMQPTTAAQEEAYDREQEARVQRVVETIIAIPER